MKFINYSLTLLTLIFVVVTDGQNFNLNDLLLLINLSNLGLLPLLFLSTYFLIDLDLLVNSLAILVLSLSISLQLHYMKPILLYLVDRPFHHLSYVEFPVTYQTYLALQTLRVVGKGSRLDETQGGLANLHPAEVAIGEVLDGFEGGEAYLALATWVLADFWGRLAD